MTEIDLDHESAKAVEALVYRLKNREPGTDDEVFALEYVTAMRGHGWRPTLAQRVPWQRVEGDSRLPDASKDGGAQYLAAKQALAQRREAQNADQEAARG
jgi:hypothetical protein